MPVASDQLERLTRAAAMSPGAPKKRMLIIVNPYATTVSDRLRNLVVWALEGRYDVEAIDTQARGHATELCREAAHEGYDVVVSFGGDGTLNEALNGIVGSETPLTCLPGGSTNVYCRILGIPNEIVDATEHILSLADRWEPRTVDVGSVNDRAFGFSAGLGLDASVVERVDSHPQRKARFGPYYYTYAAISTFASRYVLRPPRLRLTAEAPDGTRIEEEGVTAIVQNAAPFTYFQSRRIDVAAGATLDGGSLSAAVLRRASAVDMPTVLWRAFAASADLTRHRQIRSFAGVDALSVTTADGRPLPLQVDGDFIGEVSEAHFAVRPAALRVVS